MSKSFEVRENSYSDTFRVRVFNYDTKLNEEYEANTIDDVVDLLKSVFVEKKVRGIKVISDES